MSTEIVRTVMQSRGAWIDSLSREFEKYYASDLARMLLEDGGDDARLRLVRSALEAAWFQGAGTMLRLLKADNQDGAA